MGGGKRARRVRGLVSVLALMAAMATPGSADVGFAPMKPSGRCDDDAANGWGWIEDKATCEKAVAALDSS